MNNWISSSKGIVIKPNFGSLLWNYVILLFVWRFDVRNSICMASVFDSVASLDSEQMNSQVVDFSARN